MGWEEEREEEVTSQKEQTQWRGTQIWPQRHSINDMSLSTKNVCENKQQTKRKMCLVVVFLTNTNANVKAKNNDYMLNN
jgi:hypothetical protein